MAADDEQRIKRLTPLKDVLNAIDAVARPVVPYDIEPQDAIGQVLAADVVTGKLPQRATALQDGWAVRADELADAGGYAPVRLTKPPPRVEVGDEMPAGADAVAPVEAIVMRDDAAEAVATATAGDGVSPAGSETDPSKPLRRAGERVRSTDVAVLVAAGVSRVSVRAPSLLVAVARGDSRLLPTIIVIGRDCAAHGGVAISGDGIALEDALREEGCDAVVVIGGTGSGARDRSVQTLARFGKVAVHGVGLAPGQTAAFGHVRTRPVLIVPGRLDSALAAWLVLGRRLLARLSGGRELDIATRLPLARKVTSTVGLAEVVPVRHDNTGAVPLASKTLPLWALSQANGWLLVPPESEGFPAGAEVAIYDWP